jgi:hypothetical protein
MTEYRYFHESGISETIIWPPDESSDLENLKSPTFIHFRPIHQKLNLPNPSTIRLDLGNNIPIPTEKDPWPVPVELPPGKQIIPLNRSTIGNLPPALGSEPQPISDPIFQGNPKPE